MEREIIKKENGEVRIINANEELLHEIKAVHNNPCTDCSKGYADCCQKIADINNKDITKYDFITDGYQINSSNGELENLVVCKCSNFTKDANRPRPKTYEQLQHLKQLKENLKIMYFGTCDIEEADRKQRYLMSRGLLTEYTPSTKKIR